MSIEHYKSIVSAVLNADTFRDMSSATILRVADTVYNDVVLPLMPTVVDYSTHDGRVLAALSDPEVMEHMRNGKKINAIKRLRAVGNLSLKDAKEAVEDTRVYSASGYTPPSYY